MFRLHESIYALMIRYKYNIILYNIILLYKYKVHWVIFIWLEHYLLAVHGFDSSRSEFTGHYRYINSSSLKHGSLLHNTCDTSSLDTLLITAANDNV